MFYVDKISSFDIFSGVLDIYREVSDSGVLWVRKTSDDTETETRRVRESRDTKVVSEGLSGPRVRGSVKPKTGVNLLT